MRFFPFAALRASAHHNDILCNLVFKGQQTENPCVGSTNIGILVIEQSYQFGNSILNYFNITQANCSHSRDSTVYLMTGSATACRGVSIA